MRGDAGLREALTALSDTWEYERFNDFATDLRAVLAAHPAPTADETRAPTFPETARKAETISVTPVYTACDCGGWFRRWVQESGDLLATDEHHARKCHLAAPPVTVTDEATVDQVVAGVRAWCAINEIAEPPLDWAGLGEFLARIEAGE